MCPARQYDIDMHQSSYDTMGVLLAKYADGQAPLRVLEVGSMVVGSSKPAGSAIVGGTYRAHCPPPWTCTGLDLAPGVNVDVVAVKPYCWPLDADSVDLVISGQCLEHVPEPWTWMDEVYRVCALGGLCIVIAPSGGPCHRFPLDCWRIMPDGMKHILQRSGFEVLETGLDYQGPQHWNDCWGVGRKPHE